MNGAPVEEDEDNPAVRNPEVDGEDGDSGLKISKVPFEELVKVFPNTHEVCVSLVFEGLLGGVEARADLWTCGNVVTSRRRLRSSSRLRR